MGQRRRPWRASERDHREAQAGVHRLERSAALLRFLGGDERITDAYTLLPGANALVTIVGGEHMLGGIDGITGHAANENPVLVRAVQRLTWAWLRTALFTEDRAWPQARAELAASSVVCVEERG